MKVVALIKATNLDECLKSYRLAKTCDFDNVVVFLNEEDKTLAQNLAREQENIHLIIIPELDIGAKFLNLIEVSEAYCASTEDHLKITTFCDFPEKIHPDAKTVKINEFIKEWREEYTRVFSYGEGGLDALIGSDICTSPNHCVKHRLVIEDHSGGFGYCYRLRYVTKHKVSSGKSESGNDLYYPYAGIGIYTYKAIADIATEDLLEISNLEQLEETELTRLVTLEKLKVNVKPIFGFKVAAYDYEPNTIKTLLDKIEKISKDHSDLRFLQLVLNAAMHNSNIPACPDLYYMLDSKLKEKLDECY